MRRRVTVVTIAAAVAVLLLCAGLIAALVVGVLALTSPVAQAGDAFMQALKERDYGRAYRLCAPVLKEGPCDPADLSTLIEERALRPDTWSWNSRSIGGDEGSVEGRVTYANGRSGDVAIEFVRMEGQWRVAHFSLR